MNTCCVVISYHPAPAQLERLCQTLVGSGAKVVIVDNTEGNEGNGKLIVAGCTVIALGRNTGIAHAQNVGIRAAIGERADAIVLFDQDSEPDAAFLGHLLTGLTHGKPGVAAPVCLDRVTGQEAPSYRLDRMGRTHKVFSAGAPAPRPVDLVIASGCAATASTSTVAGLMDEDFFIDFVDFEWCLRCRDLQIPVQVMPKAVMRHSIGQRAVNLGFMRGTVHGAGRTYYKVRNCFLLFRKRHVPVVFALRATLAALFSQIFLLPFVQDRRQYVETLLLAIRHGLGGIVGENPVTATRGSRRI